MRSVKFLATSFFLSIGLVLSAGNTAAQSRTNATGTGGMHEIRGRLFLPDGRSPELPIRVELQGVSNFATLSVDTDRNGVYSFRALSPGNYTVSVNATEMFEPFRDSVTIDTQAQVTLRLRPTPIVINLPIHLQTKRTIVQKAAVINAKLASVPKAAVELYEKAQNSIGEGEFARAQTELRQALALHPAFSIAWNDLGVLLDKGGDHKGALEAFRSAVKFDHQSTAAILNLGCSLADAKEFTEAEKYLAVALTKDRSLYRGHYYMGVVQTKLGRLDIAEQAFLKAIELGGPRSGKAHYMLAGVYWATFDYKQAADHLETYLKLEPAAKDAPKVRESIAELRKKQNDGKPKVSANPFS
jgi:tetratricopeptide (TPR) repeat protein